MSGVSIVIDQRSLARARRAIDRFLSATAGARQDDLLDAVGAVLESQTQARFETKTGPDGQPWEDWSESYAGSKHGAKNHPRHPSQRRESGGHSILELYGHLRHSITREVRPGEVLVGSNLRYARIHQLGGDAGRNHATHINPRPYLGLSGENAAEVESVVEDFIGRLVAA